MGPLLAIDYCTKVVSQERLGTQAVTPLCGGIACTRPSVRPSARRRKPRRWPDIDILAYPPPPEPSIPARSRSALAACRPPVHVSHARGVTSSQSDLDFHKPFGLQIKDVISDHAYAH